MPRRPPSLRLLVGVCLAPLVLAPLGLAPLGLAPRTAAAAPPEGPASPAGAARAEPTPAPADTGGLVEEGVRLSARLAPAELHAALAARVARRNPGVDPDPNAALLAFGVGVRRLASGDVETGLGLMRHAYEHDIVPRFPPGSRPRQATTKALADACRVHGCPNVAEPLYEALLAEARAHDGGRGAESIALQRDLGETRRRQKAYDVAEQTLRAALRTAAEAEPPLPEAEHAPLHDALAVIYLETEQPQPAHAALVEGLRLRRALPPTDAARVQAAEALARFYLRHRRPTAAAEALAEVVEGVAAPGLPALLALGEALFAQGRYDRAAAALDVGHRRLSATLPATDPAHLPWLYARASAYAAAGHTARAAAEVEAARAVVRAHPEAAGPFTPGFLDLTGRLERAQALAARAAHLPASPFPLPAEPAARPDPGPDPGPGAAPKARPAHQTTAADPWAAARRRARRGDLAGALKLGTAALARGGTGRLELAAWAARSGKVGAALGWLCAAARLEGLDPAQVAAHPDLAAVRADPRQRGLMADLEAVALHWRQSPAAVRVVAEGADPDPEGLRWVLITDAEGDPTRLVDPVRDGPRVAPDVAVALAGPVGLGPRRTTFTGQAAADDAHLRRQLDRLERPVRPGKVVVVGVGAAAAVALAVARHDPDYYLGAVALSAVDAASLPAVARGPLDADRVPRLLLPCVAGHDAPEGALAAALGEAGARLGCVPGALWTGGAPDPPDFVAWRAALLALR